MENKIQEAFNWAVANKEAVGLIAIALTGAVFSVRGMISALKSQGQPSSDRSMHEKTLSALNQTTRILEDNNQYLSKLKNKGKNN